MITSYTIQPIHIFIEQFDTLSKLVFPLRKEILFLSCCGEFPVLIYKDGSRQWGFQARSKLLTFSLRKLSTSSFILNFLECMACLVPMYELLILFLSSGTRLGDRTSMMSETDSRWRSTRISTMSTTEAPPTYSRVTSVQETIKEEDTTC